EGDGLLQEAPHTEELRQVFPVLLARQPGLAPLRRVHLRVVPRQHPDGRAPAALGGTDRRLGIRKHHTADPNPAVSRPRAEAGPGTATPSGRGGSCPASVRRSDGGCGARTKYVTGHPGTGTGTT